MRACVVSAHDSELTISALSPAEINTLSENVPSSSKVSELFSHFASDAELEGKLLCYYISLLFL